MLVQISIAVAVCVGGYLFLTSPAKRSLSQVMADQARLEPLAVEADHIRERLPEITREIAALEADRDQIERAGRFARDRGAMFKAIGDLASSHGVRIEQIDPVDMEFSVKEDSPAEDAQAPGESPERDDLRAGFNVRVVGSYSDFVGFMRSLRRRLGYALVTSVRITPTYGEGSPEVSAKIQLEQYAFDVTLPPSPILTEEGDGW